ncbi:MAG: ferritin family protein [Rhodospirillaceae bacterium]
MEALAHPGAAYPGAFGGGEKMPDFGNPFSVLKHDRKLTHEELVRAIRFMVAAEYEAIQLYEQLAESTDNVLAQNVLRDIADEEKVHAGEFLRLLKELQPDEADFYREGAAEVEEEFLGQGAPGASAGAAGSGLGIGSLKKTDARKGE